MQQKQTTPDQGASIEITAEIPASAAANLNPDALEKVSTAPQRYSSTGVTQQDFDDFLTPPAYAAGS